MADDKVRFRLDKQDVAILRNKIVEHSLKFFLASYSKEGKTDGGFVRWKNRKVNTGKRLLYDTGKMKKSFKTVNVSSNKAKIINTAPYSGYHNEGTADLPKREILYNSKELDEQIEDLIIGEIDKIFKK
jgi:phage gpG-like protein